MKNSRNRVVTVSIVLVLALLIFVLPLVAASEFSFRGAGGKGHSFINYVWLIHQDGFASHLLTSLTPEAGEMAFDCRIHLHFAIDNSCCISGNRRTSCDA